MRLLSNNSTERSVSLRERLISIPTLASFTIATSLIIFVLFRFDISLNDVWSRLQHSNPWFFLLALISHYTTFLFRGARWKILLGNAQSKGSHVPSLIHCSRIILISWFANSLTWLRLGDAYRAYIYTEDIPNTSFSRTIGTVVAERIVDVVLVGLLLSIAVIGLISVGSPTYISMVSVLFVMIAALFLVGVIGLLVVMRVFRNKLAHLLPSRVATLYRRFYQGTVGSFKRIPLITTLGILAWIAEFARLFFVAKALGLSLSIPMVVFVALAHAILSLVPITPGGLGLVEPGVAGLLGLSLEKDEAIAMALIDRSITYLSIILTGGVLFALRQATRVIRSRKLQMNTEEN